MTHSLNVSDAADRHLASAAFSNRSAVLMAMPSPLQSLAQDELGSSGRRLLISSVVIAHLLGGWALWQLDAAHTTVAEATPIMISMIAAQEPPKTAHSQPPQAAQPPQPHNPAPTPVPLLAAATSSTPTAVAIAAPQPASELVQPTPTVAAEPSAVVAPPPPPTPPAPKQIPPSAVRYLVEPRMTVPLLSRRLKESGTVYLHIVVDARGLLKDAEISKSSGFTRLDEQALHDIRSARFTPQTEGGRPLEWQTIAPMAYEVD